MKCRNCNYQLSETDKFCPECGAKVIHNRLTVKNLFAHFSEQFLNWDNKFLQTFIDLIRRPEVVIGLFIQGTRKRYVNVVSYLAIAITFAGFFTFVNQKFYPGTYAKIFEGFEQDEMQAEVMADFYTFIIEYQTFIFFLMVPLLALMSKLVFLRNKKYNYTEHLVINMYAYSEASLMITFLSFFLQLDDGLFATFSILFLPIQVLYFAYVLKRLFGLSFLQIVLKSLLFLLVLLAFYIISIVIVVVGLLVFTDFFQKAIEAERARQAVGYIISSARNWTS